jgi:hypothetical protein
MRVDKKEHRAVHVADPDLDGAGVEIESALLVDFGVRIERGEDLDADYRERARRRLDEECSLPVPVPATRHQ